MMMTKLGRLSFEKRGVQEESTKAAPPSIRKSRLEMFAVIGFLKIEDYTSLASECL